MRILGIDYGLSKIGVAIADTDTKMAVPFLMLKNDERLIDMIKKMVVDDNIEKVVVGMPLSEAGHNIGQQEETQKFVMALNDEFDIPVESYDERFTTAEAKRLMSEGGMSGDDDAIAAMLMLQSYLDSKQV